MWGDSESNQAPVSVLRQSDFDCLEPLDKENIHSISLFDFDIHHVNDDAFSGMSRLEWLTLYNFGLTTIPSLGLIKDTLSEIDFSYNQISHIPDDYFEECGRLTEILLIGNLLKAITLPEHSPLKIINLSCNEISTMPDFDAVSETLQTVDLDGNFLDDCGSLCKGRYPRLEEVRLNGNLFESFPLVEVAHNWNSLRLYLNGNPIHTLSDFREINSHYVFIKETHDWSCDSRLNWLLHDAYSVYTDTYTQYHYGHEIPAMCNNASCERVYYNGRPTCGCVIGLDNATCSSPTDLRGKTLEEVYDSGVVLPNYDDSLTPGWFFDWLFEPTKPASPASPWRGHY